MMCVPRRPLLLLLAACVAAGCGGGSPATDAGQDVAPDTSLDPGPDAPADVDGEDGHDGGPCTDPELLGDVAPPEAIRIARLEANPGVTIPLWVDGGEIAPASRNARMPQHRPTLVRGYVELLAGWSAREIEARLVLERPGSTTCTLVETLAPSSASTAGDPGSTFNFLVPAEEVVAGALYHVELSDPASAPGPGTADTRVPVDGGLPLGVTSGTMHMRVVIVPVDFSHGGCARLADTSEEHLRELHGAMFQQNPLGSLDLVVHEPLVWTDPLATPADLSSLLRAVVELRLAEAVGDDPFYYGLFDNCGACIDVTGEGDCTRGLAVGEGGFVPPGERTRNAVGQAGVEREPWAFVHETGHMQGRNHVDCPGPDPGGTDSAYPYADGSVGAHGYGVVDGLLRDPDTYVDYMTICERPTWVSDYTWEAVFERVLTLAGP